MFKMFPSDSKYSPNVIFLIMQYKYEMPSLQVQSFIHAKLITKCLHAIVQNELNVTVQLCIVYCILFLACESYKIFVIILVHVKYDK